MTENGTINAALPREVAQSVRDMFFLLILRYNSPWDVIFTSSAEPTLLSALLKTMLLCRA